MSLKSKMLLSAMSGVAALSLAACSIGQDQKTTTSSNEQTEQSSSATSSKKETKAIQKDTETLLNAMLTNDDNGFSRLYGENYSTWSDKVNKNAAKERVEELGVTPEADWTFVYYDAPLTPTELINNFLETRRNMLQKIEDYEVVDVVAEDDETATVSIELKGINALEMAQVTRDLKGKILSDDFTLFIAESDSEELDKLDLLINFYLVDGIYGHKFLGSDVPYVEIPFTEDAITVEFTLKKDGDSNWVISESDYRALVSDLLVTK